MTADQPVVDYLQTLRDLDPDPAAISALRAVKPRRRRLRNALTLSLVIVAGSSALAAATGVLSRNPDPIPPARVVHSSVPAEVTAVLSVFDRPQDRSAEARIALTALRSPFVVDAGSIRAVGDTAYVAFARTDLDALPPKLRQHEPPGGTQGVYVVARDGVGDGPFPLADIERGTAWGIKELPAGGRRFTAVVPDGVARVELRLESGTRTTHAVQANVVLAPVDAEGLDGWSWLDADGRTLRSF
ncbi:hypothetical protein OJ997_06055 [Solirubrobacter phytolaccae]|uniref:Uncharacterized protein n=1 Tax=Solirubrobacter phytolaccae TaxID=1404360 RepID=A0A9X3N7F8_9ACTN|nr:hypothetical protein [Solirubrobacter phytolaccae]MDA0179850.1 hypothetical protein [Solirubrobacter phytolaccae]